MNIVIPLGSGSRWSNNELRYCLRSIEKHLTGWEKIIIVGVLPAWIKKNDRLLFIPAEDKIGAQHKEENIHRKIMTAIKGGAGKNFLFMNDDHFLLQDFDAQSFPYHHKGLLSDTIGTTRPKNPYIKTLRNTLNVCGNVFNYDTHCPIVYNSETYIKKVNAFRFPGYGFCIKTLYCEGAGIDGYYYPDCKLSSPPDAINLDSLFSRPYFSIGNKAIGKELELILNCKYPVPSCFELEYLST